MCVLHDLGNRPVERTVAVDERLRRITVSVLLCFGDNIYAEKLTYAEMLHITCAEGLRQVQQACADVRGEAPAPPEVIRT